MAPLLVGSALVGAFGAAFLVGGCNSQSSVGVTTSGISSASGIGGFTITTIQGQSSSQFTTNANLAGAAFFNSDTLAIVGACERGVSSVQVSVNGAVGQTYSCSGAGVANISLPLGADGEYTLSFNPLSSSGAATGATPATQVVYAKATAPLPVAITSMSINGSALSASPSSTNAGTVTISGTFSPNTTTNYATTLTENLYGQGTMEVNASAQSWTYEFNLSQGQSISLSFVVGDIVGNLSQATSLTVTTGNLLSIYAFSGAGDSDANSSSSGALAGGTNYLTAISALAAGGSYASNNTLYVGVPLDDAEVP
jgi:hypothetical protein